MLSRQAAYLHRRGYVQSQERSARRVFLSAVLAPVPALFHILLTNACLRQVSPLTEYGVWRRRVAMALSCGN